VLLGHGPNEAFMVPYSCRATERNGNSVSADVTDKAIENNENDVRFRQFGRCYTYIVVKYKIILHSL